MGGAFFGAEIEEDVMGIIEKSYYTVGMESCQFCLWHLNFAGSMEEKIGLPDLTVINHVYLSIVGQFLLSLVITQKDH